MADKQHVALLKQGSDLWNRWRQDKRGLELDLTQADLHGANLARADLRGANLGRANLSGANLRGAQLRGADLSGADLVGANLSGADLMGANLSKASLLGADLSGADLSRALLNAVNLSRANISGAEVTSVHWDRSRMRGKYLGIRGLDSCFGNALFRRAAADQDFLDTLEAHWRGTWRIRLFQAWGWLDYGRSMGRVAAFGFGMVSLFAAIFYRWPELLHYEPGAQTWFTPYYYSIVTFTTLGFGDVRPVGTTGEIVASIEVVIGYFTLGLLLAVLAEKLARRS
jgi:hypothetical protein